ncbi:MAG: hypothetical protein AAGF98_19210 [Cyanobacteria bacterium P01_H01_bin.153]
MSVSYKYPRFPIEVIRHCVWLYYTFPLSYCDIEKMMLYRGIELTDEAIRKWGQKFPQPYAHQIRRRCPQPSDLLMPQATPPISSTTLLTKMSFD